jgi:hypothetical protein
MALRKAAKTAEKVADKNSLATIANQWFVAVLLLPPTLIPFSSWLPTNRGVSREFVPY